MQVHQECKRILTCRYKLMLPLGFISPAGISAARVGVPWADKSQRRAQADPEGRRRGEKGWHSQEMKGGEGMGKDELRLKDENG